MPDIKKTISRKVVTVWVGIKAEFITTPPMRLRAYGLLLAGVILYFGWCILAPKPKSDYTWQPAAPSVPISKRTGEQKVVVKYYPKEVIVTKWRDAPVKDGEQVIATGAIPPAPNGADAIATMNMTTGESRIDYKLNPPPWFALERANYIGAGTGVSTERGQSYEAYYKRDLLRVKDVHFQIEINAETSQQKPADAGIKARLEYRF